MFDKTRIIWGVLMALAVVVVLLIDQFLLTFALFLGLLYLAFDEAKKLFNLKEASFLPVILAFILGTLSYKVLIFGILALILVLFYLAYKKAENLNLALIYIYPTLPIFALFEVYVLWGNFALFWLIAVVCLCDSFAYFIGKFMGKTPFCKTSPKKTLEGVVGGILCATLLGSLIGLFEYKFLFSLLCAFCVSLGAVAGDLLESYFKRMANVKDSSSLIPGHGGVLDRIDAVMIASFVMLGLL